MTCLDILEIESVFQLQNVYLLVTIVFMIIDVVRKVIIPNKNLGLINFSWGINYI